jgi:hypothetical protein
MAKASERSTMAFAWKIDVVLGSGICQWAEPTREALKARGKPTPNAKIVPVRIVEVKRGRRAATSPKERP